MDSFVTIVIVALGALVGGFVVWAINRGRLTALREQTGAALTAKELHIGDLTARLNEALTETASLRTRLGEEGSARAASDARAARIPELETRNEELRRENNNLGTKVAELVARRDEEQLAAKKQLALLNDAQKQLSDAFQALSAEALRNNNASFLELAKSTLATFQETAKGDLSQRQQAIDELVKPIRETLGAMTTQIQDLETKRASAYSEVTTQITAVHQQISTETGSLRTETARLAQALRAPAAGGRWENSELRRVVELAGMLDRCDFEEQVTVAGEDRNYRPDMVVHLPGGTHLVVDAKAPLDAYFKAIEATDETARTTHLTAYVRQIVSHMAQLSSKAYWTQFEPSPEFVVMFLPGESFFSTALVYEPGLIDDGIAKRVILASPTTLIALLKAVAYGWRQESIAENARKISDLGRELHDRLTIMTDHLAAMGKSLASTVQHYNKTVASYESRVQVTARRFKELGAAGGDELAELTDIELTPRRLEHPDAE